jgi:methionine-rich copper-binding protein CopC
MSFSFPRAALLVAASCLPMLAGPALAHASLVKANPTPSGMAMQMPTALTLTFSEAPELAFTRVAVRGPGGALQTGQLSADSNPDTIIVPLPANLPEGKYTVDWTAVADDGHKTTGSYSFVAMH